MNAGIIEKVKTITLVEIAFWITVIISNKEKSLILRPNINLLETGDVDDKFNTILCT